MTDYWMFVRAFLFALPVVALLMAILYGGNALSLHFRSRAVDVGLVALGLLLLIYGVPLVAQIGTRIIG
jgi:hypothetical protein